MRAFLAITLFVVALACSYLFATGATQPPWKWGETEFLERILAPFQVFSFFSGVLVLSAAVAFLLSLICFECEGRTISDSRKRSFWAPALHLGFLANAAVVGVILFVLVRTAYASGEETSAADIQTLGMLFGAGLLEAVVGSVLAAVLFFFRQARVLYFSTLLVHITEVVALGVIFLRGTA